MTDKEFISLLQRNDPIELLDIIRSNGQEPKMIDPFTYLDDIPNNDSNMVE